MDNPDLLWYSRLPMPQKSGRLRSILITILATPMSMASPMSWVSYSAQTGHFGNFDSGQQSVSSLPLNLAFTNGGIAESATGFLRPTDLHLLVQTSVTLPHTQSAFEDGILTAFDTLSIMSSTLASGTLVDVGFSLTMNSSASTVGYQGPCNPSNTTTPNSSAWVRGNWNLDTQSVFNSSCNDVNGIQNITTILHTSVGSAIPVRFAMGWGTVAGNPFGGGESSSSVLQAAHSGFVNISILTPGADYSSASGLRYDYTDAVATPEPSSIFLIGIVFAYWTIKLKGRSISGTELLSKDRPVGNRPQDAILPHNAGN